jgi:hypothetical protein
LAAQAATVAWAIVVAMSSDKSLCMISAALAGAVVATSVQAMAVSAKR